MTFVLETSGDLSWAAFVGTVILALTVAHGLKGWVGDVFARLRWMLGGGPSIGSLVTIDSHAGEVAHIGLTRVTLRMVDGSTTRISLGAINVLTHHKKDHQGCVVDIVLPSVSDQTKYIEGMVVTRTETIRERFPNILRAPPRVIGRRETNAGQNYIRVYFPIWPGSGQPIEEVFKPQISGALKKIDPEYADWMIMVTYDSADAE
ncbi:MAG: mechanosensitive ion channel [Alphaproteobacteria bacterium]|nr:mechanosensitive ion channel [Alphaproteobacteria bacterium]